MYHQMRQKRIHRFLADSHEKMWGNVQWRVQMAAWERFSQKEWERMINSIRRPLLNQVPHAMDKLEV